VYGAHDAIKSLKERMNMHDDEVPAEETTVAAAS
jgi:hypothetical protein